MGAQVRANHADAVEDAVRQEHDEQVAAGEFDQWNADDLRSSAIDRRKRAEELVRNVRNGKPRRKRRLRESRGMRLLLSLNSR